MKIKNMMVAGATMLATAVVMTSPVSAVSCPKGSVRSSANTLGECNVKEDNSLIPTINQIINVIIGVLGLVAVVVIVLGGVTYVTSAGDPGKTKKAKDTILYGIVGLVVAILAFAIVNFVLSTFFSGGSGTPAPTTT